MGNEKMICWQHFGFEKDIVVYHMGGDYHWVEAIDVLTGRRTYLRQFSGAGAREEAIEYANGLNEASIRD